MKAAILKAIGQWGKDNNSTEFFEGFSQAEVKRIKGNKKSAASPAPESPEPEQEPEEQEEEEAEPKSDIEEADE